MVETEPRAKSNWPLIIGGGALLFIGTAAGAYFSSGGQEHEPLTDVPAYTDDEPTRRPASAPLPTADSAVRRLETQEQAQISAEQLQKLGKYNDMRIKCRDALAKRYARDVDLKDDANLEAANFISSLLGLENRMSYTVLDPSDPAVNYFAYRQADYAWSRYLGTEYSMQLLHGLSKETENSILSREDLIRETDNWKKALYERYGSCFSVPDGYGIVEVADIHPDGYLGFKGGPFVGMKSRPDVWIDAPKRKKRSDPNYDIGPNGLLKYGDLSFTKGDIGFGRIDGSNLVDFQNVPDLKKLSDLRALFEKFK